MRKNVCEYCDKEFSLPQNLQTHIKTAKYCLKIRGEDLDTNYVCEYCETQFTQKAALKLHLRSCQKIKTVLYSKNVETLNQKITTLEYTQSKLAQEKDKNRELTHKNKVILNKLKQFELSEQKLLKELDEKNAKIREQDDKIRAFETEIATSKGIVIGINNAKPQVVNHNSGIITNTNNTTVKQKLSLIPTNNIKPLTIDLINKNISKYDYNAFLTGELGIANFIKGLTILELDDGTVEKNYACTNRSRNTFHRLVEDKEWKQDGGARYIQEILTALSEPASEHMDQLTKELNDEPVRSNKKQVLLEYQNKLANLEYGLRNKNSKEREAIFDQVKAKIRDTNGC
jgi:hypothetical protein